MTDYLREVLKAARGLADSNVPDLTGLSLTVQEEYDLIALVQLICMAFDQPNKDGWSAPTQVFNTVFDYHCDYHGAADTLESLDIYRSLLSKSHLKKDRRLDLARQFRRAEKTGMKKAQFLREVMKVRPEDENDQRRYLDRCLEELDKLHAELGKIRWVKLDKIRRVKS